MTSDGETSPECDMVILDQSTPPLFDDELQVVPIECVHGHLEVRSHLDGPGLAELADKIRVVKAFEKKAFFPQVGAIRQHSEAYGRDWDYFPVFGAIISFDSIAIPTLAEQLAGIDESRDIAEWVDAIHVLRRGSVVYRNRETGVIENRPNDRSNIITALESGAEPLRLATMHLQQAFSAPWMPRFSLLPYLRDAPIGVMTAQWTVDEVPDLDLDELEQARQAPD